jgi:predicted Zn-dependent protease
MLGREFIEDRIRRALQFASGDETQITVLAHDLALTRYANNIIHQNVAETNCQLTVKMALGKQVGLATTNDLSDEGLEKATSRAKLHARRSPVVPEFQGFPEPTPIISVDALDEETASYSPDLRALSIEQICDMARESDLNAYGIFSTRINEIAVGNSRSLLAYHAGTSATIQATIAGDNGSSMASSSSGRVSQLDADGIGREAVARAIKAQDPQPIEPSQYDVVLGPHAVTDIIENLNWTGVSAEAVQEGRSWMVGRIGSKAMSPLVSIWDDGRDSTGFPLPFDFEGLPRQKVKIIDEGIIGSPVYDRYTAAKDSVKTTGHASPPNIQWLTGPIALHLYMGAGDTSLEEMIQSTDRGLYINRFWYTRTVHPKDCIITGMTRDGVWMIENGELAFPVKDMRFTQSYVQALANVISVGANRHLTIQEYGGAFYVPALKIVDFNFTSRTA